MEIFVQQIANGIMTGTIYALMALGLTIIYGVMQIPDFAMGHKAMLGAYVAFFAVSLWQQNYWIALIIAMAAISLVGLATERLVFRPLKNAPPINGFIAAFGLIMVFESFALNVWGATFRQIDVPYVKQLIQFGGVNLTLQRLLIIIISAVFIVLLDSLVRYTKIGKAMRAVAQQPKAALLMGIDVNSVSMFTLGLGSALGAVSGVLIGPISMVYPTMGTMLVIKAFIVVVIGGMGNIPGAIIGGIFLGLIESLGGAYVSAAYKDVVAFGLLVIILAVYPRGLFGKVGA